MTSTNTEDYSDLQAIEFTARATATPAQPLVTLQRKGSFSLNIAARALLEPDLDTDISVVLGFDPKRRVITMRVSDSEIRHSYPVRKQNHDSHTWLVAGQAFCGYFEIDTSYTRRYAVKAIAGPTLIVDLRTEELPAQAGRTGKSKIQDNNARQAE